MELVRRGLVSSREVAQAAIARGGVTVAGAPALKPSRLVAADQSLALAGEPPRFASRGGEKLDAALTAFRIQVSGRSALDAGASTGGFTDCLLQRGAAAVVAVDVGHGQLHERLRTDSRVHVVDRTNVRYLTLGDLPPTSPARAPDLVVVDLSFISLRTVAGALADLAGPGADIVALIKPQFEVGRAEATRHRGVIADPELWRSAITGVLEAMAAHGQRLRGLMASPILGAEGNAEFLAHFHAGTETGDAPDPAPAIDAAVAAAAQG